MFTALVQRLKLLEEETLRVLHTCDWVLAKTRWTSSSDASWLHSGGEVNDGSRRSWRLPPADHPAWRPCCDGGERLVGWILRLSDELDSSAAQDPHLQDHRDRGFGGRKDLPHLPLLRRQVPRENRGHDRGGLQGEAGGDRRREDQGVRLRRRSQLNRVHVGSRSVLGSVYQQMPLSSFTAAVRECLAQRQINIDTRRSDRSFIHCPVCCSDSSSLCAGHLFWRVIERSTLNCK